MFTEAHGNLLEADVGQVDIVVRVNRDAVRHAEAVRPPRPDQRARLRVHFENGGLGRHARR